MSDQLSHAFVARWNIINVTSRQMSRAINATTRPDSKNGGLCQPLVKTKEYRKLHNFLLIHLDDSCVVNESLFM